MSRRDVDEIREIAGGWMGPRGTTPVQAPETRGRFYCGASSCASKFTPKGAFSVGGSKETAYAVYEALHDTTSPGYGRIRPSVVDANDAAQVQSDGSPSQLSRVDQADGAFHEAPF